MCTRWWPVQSNPDAGFTAFGGCIASNLLEATTHDTHRTKKLVGRPADRSHLWHITQPRDTFQHRLAHFLFQERGNRRLKTTRTSRRSSLPRQLLEKLCRPSRVACVGCAAGFDEIQFHLVSDEVMLSVAGVGVG